MPENETRIGDCAACETQGVRVKHYGEDRRTGDRVLESRVELCVLCAKTYTGNTTIYPAGTVSPKEAAIDRVRLARMILRHLRKIESTMTSRAANGANAELRQEVTQMEQRVHGYDQAATQARNALRDAGVPETEGAPPGRALGLAERVRWLTRERDGWLDVIKECSRIFECPDEPTTALQSNIPNLCRDAKHGIAPTCSCDEPIDDPCPVHFRENDLQDIVLAVKESISASLGVLIRQETTEPAIRSVITILEELQSVIEAGPKPRIVAGGPRDSIRWLGDISLHAGTAAVILAAPSIRKAFGSRDAARMQSVEFAIRSHLGNAMRGGELHGFDATVDLTNNPPSVMDARHVVADIVVRLSPSASSAYGTRYDFSIGDAGRLVVRSSSLAGGHFISEGTDEVRPNED